MKFLIVLAVVAFAAVTSAAVLSEEKLAKLKEIKEQCLPESGAAPDVYDKFVNGDFSNQDKSTKCFVKCFYKKAGFFDKDDNLDIKVTLEKITAEYGAENAEKWVTPCKDVKEEDPCDKAFALAQCFSNNKNPNK